MVNWAWELLILRLVYFWSILAQQRHSDVSVDNLRGRSEVADKSSLRVVDSRHVRASARFRAYRQTLVIDVFNLVDC